MLAVPALSGAQAWPQRPVRIVIPYGPGSSPDVFARILAERLSPRLGQPVVYESRAGAGGALGMQHVAQATDGHSFLITSNAIASLPALRRGQQYRAMRARHLLRNFGPARGSASSRA